uniref:CS domain-containing protein n=1 Tax=Chenopodium quinoa TaxID=63459 RepID=A0A803N5X5_CHEQI
MEPNNTTHYEFSDGFSDLELRVLLKDTGVQSSKEIQVDVDESSLAVRIKQLGSITTLMETKQLYDRIKPGETIWYLDEDQLVINLRKQDQELKWPDIMESWESLSTGVFQLLKGTSIYIVGDSTEINQKVAEELGVGLRHGRCQKAMTKHFTAVFEAEMKKQDEGLLRLEGPIDRFRHD